MREETLRKPLFIHTQDWYRTTDCVDCPEFRFVPLPEGAVAYCRQIEDERNCIFSHAEDGDERGLDTQTILDLESIPRIEAN